MLKWVDYFKIYLKKLNVWYIRTLNWNTVSQILCLNLMTYIYSPSDNQNSQRKIWSRCKPVTRTSNSASPAAAVLTRNVECLFTATWWMPSPCTVTRLASSIGTLMGHPGERIVQIKLLDLHLDSLYQTARSVGCIINSFKLDRTHHLDLFSY